MPTPHVCGTGGWSGPLPGDPDNNSILSAVPDYGGIRLSWTYPEINGFAVSYFNLFRGVNNNPALAVRRARVSADTYFDKIPSTEIHEYFYWIQIVSINGTAGEMIGPVSTTPMLTLTEIIAILQGNINSGLLSESLRAELNEIPLLQSQISAEAVARLTQGTALADALAAVQAETGQTLTYIQQEITQRANGDEALLDSVNALSVGMGDLNAAIVTESTTRATAYSALAAQVTTLETSFGTDLAAVQQTMTTALDTMGNDVTAIGALYNVKVTVNGLVGGFGVYNSGTEIEAGFDVSTFWVGDANSQIKPFVVQNGTVYMSNAVIPSIQSDNFESGVSGWRIDKNGVAEFRSISLNGTGTFAGELVAATGTFSGTLNAQSGYFGGVVNASSVMSALSNSTNYTYSTPGTYALTIPAGLDADNIRVRIMGGSGGGGGAGMSVGAFMGPTGYGGSGGAGGNGGLLDITVPYSAHAGTTKVIVVGTGGARGLGGENSYSHGQYGDAGGSGTSSSVSGIGAATGGGGGGGGAPGRLESDMEGALFPINGASGGNGASAGAGFAGGSGGAPNGGYGYPPGNPGIAGVGGYVLISIYKGDVLVKNTSYQNLLNWLDTLGHGTVPANAR